MPAQRLVLAGELLELGADLGQRVLPFLLRQFAAREKPPRAGNASGLQTLAFQRLKPAADDELGRAAADVDHQPALVGLGRLRMRHAQIDQACFLAPADHFDRMTQRGFGRHQKRLRRTQLTHRVGR